MSIKIISTQVYEDFEESNEEIYEDYEIKFIDKDVVIHYNNNEIIYNREKNTFKIERIENSIFIELNREIELVYKTPYGEATIKTCGKKLEFLEKPFSMLVEYKIKLGSINEYKNIIRILEV